MKTLYFNSICIVLALFLSMECTAQVKSPYVSNIDTAKQLYNQRIYLEAAKYYSYAFHSNHNLGSAKDRYEAARCWALGGQTDSAFYQLDRSVKANYDNYADICIDTNFKSLWADPRWSNVLQRVKSNKLVMDEYLKLKYKNLNQSLVQILDTIEQADQYPRLQIPEIEKKYGWSSVQMRANLALMTSNDSINTNKIKSILTKYGWLGKEEVGEHGNSTLFLVVQHANLATQIQYLPMLRDAVKHQKANASNLALLEDRIAIKQGRKQVYGTQLMQNNLTGKYYVLPLADPINVDKRRAEVGLPSIKDYVKQWNINWSIEQYEKDLPKDKIISIK